jgi:hypothetical protein
VQLLFEPQERSLLMRRQTRHSRRYRQTCDHESA